MSENLAGYGWESTFPEFRATPAARIRERLLSFIEDASDEQERAWSEAIPPLQREVEEVLVRDELAAQYSAILEYELPMESRRPDVVLLVGSGVLVIELKGKLEPTQADLDQVAAYARDLRNYHRECSDRSVVPVLVPTRARGYKGQIDDIHVSGPDALDHLVSDLSRTATGPRIDRAKFLSHDAYCPLPTLVQAARELMRGGSLRRIHRARAATDPAVEEIARIIHVAAQTSSRHLILLTGVPGAGKTLVGLQTVHAHYLDDLAIRRGDNRPTAPAVFLSGNGPLVEVLQYELRTAGGDGKTFVRGVRDYVRKYSKKTSPTPPEHVLVFDEAQRAFDAEKMSQTHKGSVVGSEPDQFVEFADRIPSWCVVLGLIGTGQEIHTGEESGVAQWRDAVERSPRSAEWTIHVPPSLAVEMGSQRVSVEVRRTLNLDTELRFHGASELHRLVAALLSEAAPGESAQFAERIERAGLHLRLTRELSVARDYLRSRYADNRSARFGILASAKDKSLVDFGIPNDFQSTKVVRLGPWYGDDEDAAGGLSCRRLESCVTEFGAQGLELDAALVAWGTDLIRETGRWTNARARGYQRGVTVRNPLQLRVNAYRVLLTRGRDASVVFVPPLAELDETFERLRDFGFRML